MQYAEVTYGVLLLSAICEGLSLRVALKEFAGHKGDLSYLAAVRASKDPTIFTVLMEDSAAILGLTIAFAGILGARLPDIPELDGAASIGISLLLAAMAAFLAAETKGLLIGEQASTDLEAAIMRAATEDPAVKQANGVFTVHLGPNQVVAELSAEFDPDVMAAEVEDAVERIEARIKQDYPEISMLFVKPQSGERWHARLREIEQASEPEQRTAASRQRARRRKLASE